MATGNVTIAVILATDDSVALVLSDRHALGTGPNVERFYP